MTIENKSLVDYDNIISIDPSINQCGYAIFQRDFDTFKLDSYDLISSKDISFKPYLHIQEKLEYVSKSLHIFKNLKHKITMRGLATDKTLAVIEIPSYWAVSGYSARESWATEKLSFVAGLLSSIVNKTYFLNPSDWKGSMPKEVTRNILTDHYPECRKLNHNVVDAIGIGHFFIFGSLHK